MGPSLFADMAATINATLQSETANSYVTLAEANTYFETVPSSTNWDNKTDDAKNRALISATRWIDTLNFYGDRCDADQALSWPMRWRTTRTRSLERQATRGYTSPSSSARWKSSTTLRVRLREQLITCLMFILGCSLTLVLTALAVVGAIRSVL